MPIKNLELSFTACPLISCAQRVIYLLPPRLTFHARARETLAAVKLSNAVPSRDARISRRDAFDPKTPKPEAEDVNDAVCVCVRLGTRYARARVYACTRKLGE